MTAKRARAPTGRAPAHQRTAAPAGPSWRHSRWHCPACSATCPPWAAPNSRRSATTVPSAQAAAARWPLRPRRVWQGFWGKLGEAWTSRLRDASRYSGTSETFGLMTDMLCISRGGSEWICAHHATHPPPPPSWWRSSNHGTYSQGFRLDANHSVIV